ncbi:hypothetical protein RHMOL_Rhmol08G0091400 [Rhododendron molle]|uniref:Uncharacterized protein n=1 Tax=Rhododendron molle TaxID=49168 RepID=A0ACC0MLR1_RHOML|nr:hypothetical protein RHMOL_Rhmol08G0091400 [Rhododendron molle]
MKSSTPSRRCSLSRRRSGTLSSRDFGNGNSRSQLWQDCRCSGLCSSPLLPHCVTLSRTTPSTPASYQNYFTASVVDGERWFYGSLVGEGGQKRRRRIEGTNLDCQILICFSW